MRRESVERDAPSSGGISRRQPAAFLTPPAGDAVDEILSALHERLVVCS